ncbi:hypothetical protein KWI83_12210 [Streptomyces sp. TRM70350]|nr:hypothetical protein [Streptomyces sp. TRM70350]
MAQTAMVVGSAQEVVGGDEAPVRDRRRITDAFRVSTGLGRRHATWGVALMCH